MGLTTVRNSFVFHMKNKVLGQAEAWTNQETASHPSVEHRRGWGLFFLLPKVVYLAFVYYTKIIWEVLICVYSCQVFTLLNLIFPDFDGT